MAQHRPLADAGRAAGVLQEGEVVAVQLHWLEGRERAGLQRLHEAQLPRQRHLLAAGHAAADDDDALHRCVRQRGGDGGREGFEQHQCLRAAVLQLVRQLARRVQRVDRDHRAAGAQRADQRHREGHQVGHHDRDAVALGEALALQPGGEAARHQVEFAKGGAAADACQRGAAGVACQCVVEQLHQ